MEQSPETILKELLDAAAIPYKSVTRSEAAGQTIFSIETSSDPRDLIGVRGETLQAVDHIVKKIIEQEKGRARAGLDGARNKPRRNVPCGCGRLPHEADKRYPGESPDDGRAGSIVPIRRRTHAHERTNALECATRRCKDAPNVKTESQGEGRSRRVVIKYSAE